MVVILNYIPNLIQNILVVLFNIATFKVKFVLQLLNV